MTGVGQHTNLATMTHELMHLIMGAEDLYGMQSNSQNMTVMSSTVWGGAGQSTEALRDLYLLDPWHRIRAGWLEPRIIDASAPGACYPLYPASDATNEAQSRPLPILDPAELKRFMLLEYRKRSARGSDEDMAEASGLALWFVERASLDGSEVRQVPGGPIYPGPNGRIDSVPVSGDDRFVSGPLPLITPGANRFIETLLRGDDAFLNNDVAAWTVGAARSGVTTGARGASSLWTEADGTFGIHPARGLTNPVLGSPLVRTRISETGTSSMLEVQPAALGSLRARLKKAPDRVAQGSTFQLTGMISLTSEGKTVAMHHSETGASVTLPIVSWNCSTAEVTVPSSTPLGVYDLAVYTNVVQSSNSLVLTVMP